MNYIKVLVSSDSCGTRKASEYLKEHVFPEIALEYRKRGFGLEDNEKKRFTVDEILNLERFKEIETLRDTGLY